MWWQLLEFSKEKEEKLATDHSITTAELDNV